MKKIPFYFLLVFFVSQMATAQTTVNAKSTEGVNALPQITAAAMQMLWDSCTAVDYTYFTMPISMSLDQQGSIRQSLRCVGSGAFKMKTGCKQFAKIFYQIKGRIVMDADVFYGGECSYLVFNINGVKKFANPLSTEGVNFFNQIIARQQAKGKN